MIGYLLAFSIVFGFTSLTVFGVARMRKLQRSRRREARLSSAFDRARYARMHGCNPIGPIGVGRSPFATHATWRAALR